VIDKELSSRQAKTLQRVFRDPTVADLEWREVEALIKATNPKKLVAEFKASIEEYLDFCKEDGVEPNNPLKGEVLVRCGRQIQQEIIKRVASRKSSGEPITQNEWCVEAMREKLRREDMGA
jgi:predicted HicB family RNase H-like nuclease